MAVSKSLIELVKSSHKFTSWKSRVEHSGCVLVQADVVHAIQRNHDSYYLAVLDCELLTPEGQRLRRSLLLRGAAVAVIPLFICEEVTKTVVVRQRRIVDGEYSIEFPSGGIHENQTPTAAAIIEVMEELGMTVAPHELVRLTEEPIRVVDSLFDEVVHWFAFRRVISPQELSAFENKFTGVADDQEHIVLSVLDLDKLPEQNFQTLVARRLLQKKGLCQ